MPFDPKKLEIPNNTLAEWQEIMDLLANLVNVPAGLIMRNVDPEIEVFVSSDTLGNPYKKGDREHLHGSGLYCEEVIRGNRLLLVPNALCSEKWKNNPDIKLNMISYLGYPIRLPDGTNFGTICVLDIKGNVYSNDFIQLMKKMVSLIQSHLEVLYMNRLLGDKNAGLSDYIDEIRLLRGFVPICSACKAVKNDEGYWMRIEKYIQERSGLTFTHGLCPDCIKKLYPDIDVEDE